MYNIIPMMSFVMAINGPVAMAGSIFELLQRHRYQCPENRGEHDDCKEADGDGISDRSRSSEPDKVIDVY